MYKRIKQLVFIMAIMTMMIFGFFGCAKQLDEPVFVKNLVCSSDMDASIEFITNREYERYVEDIEIPGMPKGLGVSFYDEQIDDRSKYDIHILEFGIHADELDDNGGLKEDFVFHEVIVKWDDGSETRADIGMIHMTPNYQSSILESDGGESSSSEGMIVEQRIKFIANEDMLITNVSLPYADQLSDIITDLSVNQFAATTITENEPLKLKAGDKFTISYTINYEEAKAYGEISLEGVIVGKNKKGEAFTDVFHVVDSSGRYTTNWIEQQIEAAE